MDGSKNVKFCVHLKIGQKYRKYEKIFTFHVARLRCFIKYKQMLLSANNKSACFS